MLYYFTIHRITSRYTTQHASTLHEQSREAFLRKNACHYAHVIMVMEWISYFPPHCCQRFCSSFWTAKFLLGFYSTCCARRIFQITMPILWIFRYNLWCLAVLFTMVSSTTQSIFDKILPTSSPARNESAPLSSSTITTTIKPTTTPFSSSRVTPVAPQLYTVEVGKVRIPLTFLLHTMTQLKIVQKGNFQFVPDTIHANVGDIVGRTVMKTFESRTFLTIHGRIQILPRKPLSSSSRISTPLRPIRTVRAGKSRFLLRVQTC